MVLLDRGACAFVQKVQNVIDAGGLAALLVNNQDGIVSVCLNSTSTLIFHSFNFPLTYLSLTHQYANVHDTFKT